MALRTLALPAIVVTVLPKCPMCVMVVLGALGIGHPLHETAFAAVQGAVLLAVMALLAFRRRRDPVPILVGAAGALGIMAASAGPVPPGVGYAGGLLLAAAWLAKPRGAPAPSCACPHAEPPGSR
jgi:hypothetical protein